ncbi:MAG: MFS transporter [Kordiimonadaceae bacterium]|nr:MFS transporter [Kordiimonadaceae bacterium]
MPVILFAIFIDLLGFGIIVPILPFLTMKYGGDPLVGTALISVYSLTSFIMGPIWGRLSDRIGRRPALALTFFGATLAYITLGFAESLLMLFIARAMSGATAGNIGIVMASMADISDDANRGKALAKIGAAFGLGFAFGPGIGGVLSSVDANGDVNILYAGLTAAALSFTAMILTAFFVPETAPNKQAHTEQETKALPTWTEILKQPGNFLLLCMFIVMATGQSISFSITPFWANSMLGWNAEKVGYLMMASGILVFFMQMFAVGPLFKAIGEVRALVVGASVQIFGCLLVIFGPPTAAMAIVAFPLIMGGATLAFPALNSLVSRRSCKNSQGTALGLANGFSALGRIAGPVTAGTAFASSIAAPFYIAIGTALIIIVWASAEIRNKRHAAAL